MSERFVHYALLYGANVIAVLTAAVAIMRSRRRWATWIWSATVLLALGLVVRTVYCSRISHEWGCDFRFVRAAGAYAWEGKDPYTVTGFPPPHDNEPAFVSPLNTLVWFRLIALAPEGAAIAVWAALNVLICLMFGLTARRALIAQDGQNSQIIEPSLAALLTAAVVLSLSGYLAVEAGQFSFVVTLALLGALWAQAAKPSRPAVAGACLAIAALKVQTMLPFLLLFLRWSDRRIWLFLGLFTVGLLLCAGNPAELPNRFQSLLAVLATTRQPGCAGDSSMLNAWSHTMIGFDHVFWRVGISDPLVVSVLNYAGIAALGLGLVYLVVVRRDIPRGACCSLVSLYSLLFLYHRLYDEMILIIPLIYSASRFRVASGSARWCYAWVLASIVLALNVPYGELYARQHAFASQPILRALILPMATYLVLSALGALAFAVFLERKRPSAAGMQSDQSAAGREGGLRPQDSETPRLGMPAARQSVEPE